MRPDTSAHRENKKADPPPEKDIRIVEMQLEHLDQGFLDALDRLVPGTSNLTKSKAKDVFLEIRVNPLHRIFVAVMQEQQGKDIVVGTITLLVEPKFIFNGGRVGHIEDVSVKKGYQNMRIGSRLVLHATTVAKELGCAKIVLDCSDEMMLFYEKLGYSYQDNCMKKILKE
jgi:glucosamine-phosphate N-acetyltransferase